MGNEIDGIVAIRMPPKFNCKSCQAGVSRIPQRWNNGQFGSIRLPNCAANLSPSIAAPPRTVNQKIAFNRRSTTPSPRSALESKKSDLCAFQPTAVAMTGGDHALAA